MSQQGRLIDVETNLETLTGNSGGAVGPDGAGNIDVIGSAPIDVTGNPGTNTLTIGTDGTLATDYVTDAGTANPAADVINVLGGTNMNTAGAGATVTINLDTDVLNLTDLTVDNLELNGNTLSSTDVNGDVLIFPNGTGAVVIDPYLTVGNSSANNTETINGSAITSVIVAEAEGATDLGGIQDHRHSDTAGFGAHYLGLRSRGDHTTPTVVQSGDNIWRMVGAGYDGTDYAQAGEIRIDVDGTPGSNDMPGRIVFSTSQDGAQSPTEALRISQDQRVTFSGGIVTNMTALDNTDSPYTVLDPDYYLTCDVTLGVLTIDLPDAPSTGRTYIVKDAAGNAATNNITVTTTGGVVTIDGSTTFVMNTDYQAAQFIFNGTSYEVY